MTIIKKSWAKVKAKLEFFNISSQLDKIRDGK
jgi:hypothetical protein